MQIVLKHVLRNIKEKKGRSLLIIISLIIASSVLILNLVIPNQIIENDKNKTRNLVGESDIIITNFDNFNINDIKLSDERINLVGVNQETTIHKDKTLTIYGTDIKYAADLNLVEETNLNYNEVILDETTADKYGYKVNDTMTININNTDYDLKVVSILEDKGLLYFKTYSAILNNETFNQIFNIEPNLYGAYYIDVLDNNKVEDTYDYLSDNNSSYIVQKLVDEDTIKENNQYVSLILIIIFVMAVIMIFFVVSTLNKMIVMERTPVIATFRSIGATKRKMNMILVLENVMYGLIGGILGAGTSVLINKLCVKLLTGGSDIATSIPFSKLIIGVLFAILLEVFMSIGAIIKSNKYSIKELMFDNLSSKQNISKKTSILSISCILISILLYCFVSDKYLLVDLLRLVLFWTGLANAVPLILLIISNIICKVAKKSNNGSLIIASKNLGHNKMIISSSRLVVIAISVMLVILNLSSAFDKMLDSFSLQFADYNIFIRETSKEYTEYEKLNNLDEVDYMDCVFMASDDETYNDGEKLDLAPIILGMKDSRPDIIESDYKIKNLKVDEALVDNIYLENNGWHIGDTINIKIGSQDKTHQFKIVGTVNSFYYSIQREIIVINLDYFKENISKVPNQIVLKIKDGYNMDNAIDKLEKELKDPDIVIQTVDDFVESQRKNVHTIMSLFYIIISLALMLSFVGIINNQIISFMERNKELAVLNSVCMSKKQLKKMLLIENLTSSLTAAVVGFASAIFSVKLIDSVLHGIKMYIELKFNLSIALILIGVIIIILAITVIIPINKLKKINVVEAIKYE